MEKIQPRTRMLRSLGSAGGTDILAIWLNQKYNLRIGQFNFYFNLAVFAIGFTFYDVTLVLYSVILSYTNAKVMVLSSGQDEFGFRQSGGGQEGAPKPGLVIGQVHGHVPFRPVGRDDGAGGGGQAIGVIGQGPDGVGMDGQGQAGLEVGLEGFEEAAAHGA